ncbi:MAG TPA: FadD7 family fatty acid--CoA ligase [Pseudonocardia sp.]|jgi:acyl-CoA synthetase (AMP-forming)/AMP-acid ligase II|nr:FadD7 family fatty acid--CoA ligase [Pseudonocardia sp.]
MMVRSTASSLRGEHPYRHPATTGLADLLDRQLCDRPDAPALVVTSARVPLSYRALATLVDEVAARLNGAGLRRGDPLGLVSANNAEFVVGLLAAARAGLVVAPMDPALPGTQLTARFEELGARAVLVGPPAPGAEPAGAGRTGAEAAGAAGAVSDASDGVAGWPLRVTFSPAGTPAVQLAAGTPPAQPGQETAGLLSAEDAVVLFTAGTTDRAKMVPLTHANVAASIRGISGSYELGPADATVAAMPFFHGHGLFAVLLASLASGGRVLLPARGRFSAHTFWDDVRAAGATWFTAVPTIYEILLNRSAHDVPGAEIAQLRFVRSCSAPLNTATGRAIERMLGVPLLSAYGMTETAHQATSEPLPQRGVLKQGSVGRPSGVDIRVLGPDGQAAAVGTEGEVWVHGPTVTRGYLGNPAETARSFVDGWFRTGDLGSLDSDGDLFLTGRLKNLINRGGEKIAPEHVEDIIAGCPGVLEVAVFAVPDAVYGQRVAAAVVTEGESVGSEQILRYCRQWLPAFEVPDRIELVPDLPHTPKGALDRRAVDARYGR